MSYLRFRLLCVFNGDSGMCAVGSGYCVLSKGRPAAPSYVPVIVYVLGSFSVPAFILELGFIFVEFL